MKTKLVASTEAQNNFGRLLDDVVQNNTRYIIRRRNTAQAVLLSVTDLEYILGSDAGARQQLANIIREARPVYTVGESLPDGA
jgi:prevent-host-death family protein